MLTKQIGAFPCDYVSSAQVGVSFLSCSGELPSAQTPHGWKNSPRQGRHRNHSQIRTRLDVRVHPAKGSEPGERLLPGGWNCDRAARVPGYPAHIPPPQIASLTAALNQIPSAFTALEVTCPIPTGIPNGFITFAVMREHGYKETVKYGCVEHYVLEGDAEIHCQNTGNWSSKPVCRGEWWKKTIKGCPPAGEESMSE